jgi:hypothetical protein
MDRTEIYETIATIVFIFVSLIAIKPPAWSKRLLNSFNKFMDRWI